MRLPRVVAVGVPHHLTQKGNNSEPVFLVEEDRREYLTILQRHARRERVRLLGYCLMANHVHLVALPEQPASFARGLGRGHYEYTRRFNERHGRSGHLWQNRFFSCPLDGRHLRLALAHVDLNPARAGLVADAAKYAWSSAAAHVDGRDPTGLLDMSSWTENCPGGDWAEVLADASSQDGAWQAELRLATQTGRPLGRPAFVRELEEKLGRELASRGRGRPKKIQPGGERALRTASGE